MIRRRRKTTTILMVVMIIMIKMKVIVIRMTMTYAIQDSSQSAQCPANCAQREGSRCRATLQCKSCAAHRALITWNMS